MNKLKIYISLAILSLFWWLTYGEQREIAIDLKTCEPDGLVASYRLFYWGRDFKINQINALKNDIILSRNFEANLAEVRKKIESNSLTQDLGRVMDEARVKSASPEFRDVVVAQIKAKDIEEQAEEIKRNAEQKVFEEFKKIKLRRTHACIAKLTKEVE